MAENGPIEEVAKIVSAKLFHKFKWKQYGPYDQDFCCHKESSHKPAGKTQKHTHPVDVVFHYKDPYLNSTIYLNTDLKSYAKSSINVGMIEKALISLANTIDCAQNNHEWLDKYHTQVGNFEVRGLLFVYNHDNKNTTDFYDFFYPPKPKQGKRNKAVKLDNINIPKGKQIHIIEPKLIDYMMRITNDLNELMAENTFPKEKYGFYYPELIYHKVLVSDEYLPATIELLSSPFLIIKHDEVELYNHKLNKLDIVYDSGYIVYYNRSGDKDLEFIYLLDTLSRFQLLNGENKIRIRCAHATPANAIRSNFRRAIEKYAHDWGYDSKYIEYLNTIEISTVTGYKEFYSTQELAWS
ncbi:TPA: hypothetical protein ACX6SR_000127 [Photobacterium damselae]